MAFFIERNPLSRKVYASQLEMHSIRSAMNLKINIAVKKLIDFSL